MQLQKHELVFAHSKRENRRHLEHLIKKAMLGVRAGGEGGVLISDVKVVHIFAILTRDISTNFFV